MTKKFILSTLLASLTISAVAAGCGAGAEAHAGQTQALSAGESEGGHGPGSFLQRFDRDGDGVVRLTELPERMRERLTPADTNRDGALTTEEMQAFRQARRAERFASMDTNRDGAITAQEAGERWGFVGRADANNDGRVTLDELAQAAPRRGGPGGHGGHGWHGRGHGGPEGPEGRGGQDGAEGPRGGRHGFDPARMVSRFDRNGDGRLQRDEVPPRMAERFDTVDTNRDGAVTVEEFQAAMAQRRAAREARER